jgi:hypothetical protein
MDIYNNFSELPGVSSVSNVEFFGEAEPWNQFDAKQKKELIEEIEELVRKEEQKLRRFPKLSTDENMIRRHINEVVLGLINKHKDNYADLKRELLELGVESISDGFLFDDYYDEKYGGHK